MVQQNRMLLAAFLVMMGLIATALTAGADPNVRRTEFNCNGEIVVVEDNFQGNSFHVAESTRNFLVKHGVIDGVVVYDVPGQAGRADLVTCTYTGPFTGHQFELTGFFTPRR